MQDPLPPRAETYLRQLDRELWPLSSEERETILLELRGHLIGRAAQGEERLAEALAALGPPPELARAFVDAGAGDTYRQVGLPGRSLVPVGAEHEYGNAARRLSFSDILAQVRATLLASRNGMLLVGAVLVTTLTATNFLRWLEKLAPEPTTPAWPFMLVRAAAVLLALVAAYRIVLSKDDESPWAVNLATLRFAGAILAIFAFTIGGVTLAGLAVRSLATAAGASGAALGAARLATVVLALAFFSCAALRVQPWAAAQAIGRRDVRLQTVWRGTSTRLWDIVRGWAMLVLPLYLAHFAITYAALEVVPFGAGQLALALVDALAAAGAAIAAVLLNATVFRWVTGEPIPAPRPFGTEQPSEELVEQARVRLRGLLEAAR
jgi:hypothetical protein